MSGQENSVDATTDTIASISESVLVVFFDELAKVDDLSEISVNLRKLVLVDGVLAEPAIKAVLFPDAP